MVTTGSVGAEVTTGMPYCWYSNQPPAFNWALSV